MNKLRRSVVTALVFSMAVFSASSVFAMGEKYTKEGDELGKYVFEYLVNIGYCNNVNECNQRRFLYGESGDKVHLHFYGLNDVHVISKVISCIVENGIHITNGVPIELSFYSENKNELLGIKSFTKKPIIALEINK